MSFISDARARHTQAQIISPESTAYTQRLIGEFQRENIATNVRDIILKDVTKSIESHGYVRYIDELRWSHKLAVVRQDSVPTANKAMLDRYVREQTERGWMMAIELIAAEFDRKVKKTLRAVCPVMMCGYDEHETEELSQSGGKTKYIVYVQPYVDVGIRCDFSTTLS